MKIPCPFCGDRAENEFTYGGDATVKRPENYRPEAMQAWLDYVYYRDNPRGPHCEYWYHGSGCRAWLKVQRDTLTHEIFSVELMQAQEILKPSDGDAAV